MLMKQNTNKIQSKYILIVILSPKVLMIVVIPHYAIHFKSILSFGLILMLAFEYRTEVDWFPYRLG